MKSSTDNLERHEQLIAGLLWYGTWIASTIIAVGIILGVLQPSRNSLSAGFGSYDVVKAGVALFILLPVARVALMFAIFLRERDLIYTIISALVLIIIVAGVVIGL